MRKCLVYVSRDGRDTEDVRVSSGGLGAGSPLPPLFFCHLFASHLTSKASFRPVLLIKMFWMWR